MRRTTLAAVPLMLSALLLAGCGGDEEPQADPTTASPTMSESPDTPETTESSEPEVEPASGIEVESKQFTVNLPEGWKKQKEVLGATFAYDPDNTDAIEITVVPSQPQTLDEAAKSSIRINSRDVKRVEDAELGGLPAYHLQAPGVGDRVYQEYGLWAGNEAIIIGFDVNLPEDELMTLIDSVLATWTWK